MILSRLISAILILVAFKTYGQKPAPTKTYSISITENYGKIAINSPNSNQVINKYIINNKTPTFIFADINIKEGLRYESDTTLILSSLSLGATANDVDFTVSCAASNDLKNFIYDIKSHPAMNELSPENVIHERRIYLRYKVNYKYLVFWCSGKYYGSDKTKSEPINEILIYDIKGKKSSILSGEDKVNAINWFTKQEEGKTPIKK